MSPPRTASVVLTVLAVLALTAGTQSAQSAAAKTCALSGSDQQPAGGKPTYNLSLKAKGTPCPSAVKVMRSFHSCRAKTALTCSKKVSGYTCTGRKTSSTALIFYASFTCKSGAKVITSSYQQNT
jgi:hypothetical protein